METTTINSAVAPDSLQGTRGEPWYDDGTVIIHAVGGPGHVDIIPRRFRFYQGILAQLSDVFKDMFAMGAPIAISGCPIVPLFGNPDDVEHTLRAIIDRKYLSPSEPLASARICGILRISTKYQLPELRTDVIALLKRQFPTTLSDLRARQDSLSKFQDFWDVVAEEPLLAFELVNLALETDVHEVLPYAYYHCAAGAKTPLDILDSGSVVGGKVKERKPKKRGRRSATTSPASTEPQAPRTVRLDAEAQRAILLGREALFHEQHEWFCAWACNSIAACENKRGCDCAAARRAARDTLMRGRELLMLRPWHMLWSLGTCQACADAAGARWAEAQAALWERLPLIFGLGGWETLRSE